MNGSLHRLAIRGRLLAALSLGAFLSGSLGSLVHHATTPHMRCPEHGELVHGDGAAAGIEEVGQEVAGSPFGSMRRQPAGDGSADAARIRGLPRAGRHGHDHCFVFCASREPMSGSALVAAGQTAPGPGGPLALACGPHEAAGRPLYRIAPKNSPPV